MVHLSRSFSIYVVRIGSTGFQQTYQVSLPFFIVDPFVTFPLHSGCRYTITGWRRWYWLFFLPPRKHTSGYFAIYSCLFFVVVCDSLVLVLTMWKVYILCMFSSSCLKNEAEVYQSPRDQAHAFIKSTISGRYVQFACDQYGSLIQ